MALHVLPPSPAPDRDGIDDDDELVHLGLDTDQTIIATFSEMRTR